VDVKWTVKREKPGSEVAVADVEGIADGAAVVRVLAVGKEMGRSRRTCAPKPQGSADTTSAITARATCCLGMQPAPTTMAEGANGHRQATLLQTDTEFPRRVGTEMPEWKGGRGYEGGNHSRQFIVLGDLSVQRLGLVAFFTAWPKA